MFRKKTIFINLACAFFSVSFSERQVYAQQYPIPSKNTITTVYLNLPNHRDTSFQSGSTKDILSNKINQDFYKPLPGKKNLSDNPLSEQNKLNMPAGIITLTIDTASTSCGNSNGGIVALATGGTPPYTYSYTISGNTHFQNTGNFQNLAAGSYEVIATDANGQADTAVVNLSNNFPAPSATVSSYTNPTTCSTFDGTLTVTASDGIPPYQYSFDNVNYQTSNVFTNLTQGLYSIFVKDANGCINENYTNYLYPKTSCFGIGFYYSNFECNNNGTITIGTVLGGVPPFVYSLDGINYQADNNFYNIGAGVHHMYTKDATGLVSIYTVTSSPLCPVNVTWAATDASCNQSDASMTLSPAYGNGPYAYTLDGINYQGGYTFTGLAAGNYTFTVKDANGISFSGYATIKSKCPVVFASETDETCNQQNGSISATGYNGTPPYQFSIDGINFQNSNIFGGLLAGTYIVTIKDANSSTGTTSITIKRNCFQLNINIVNAVCGNANGSITVSASYGTAPYQYSLDGNNFQTGTTFNSLAAGSYTVYAKDATNVLADSSITIADSPGPQVFIGNDTTLCTGAAYLLDAFYSNATYLWQDGSTQSSFLVTEPGTYYVAVTLDGCTVTDTIVISYLTTPQFTLGRDTTICRGEVIQLQPLVQEPANYLWQDGSTQPAYNVKDTGIYSVEVSNICGHYTDEIKIEQGLCSLMLPNAFTPNGDGLNDIFRVKYPFAIKAFRLAVYNRLGEKMFETTDMAKGWDGSCKGNSQPMGVYVWVVQITALNNNEQISRGTVTLLK